MTFIKLSLDGKEFLINLEEITFISNLPEDAFFTISCGAQHYCRLPKEFYDSLIQKLIDNNIEII